MVEWAQHQSLAAAGWEMLLFTATDAASAAAAALPRLWDVRLTPLSLSPQNWLQSGFRLKRQ